MEFQRHADKIHYYVKFDYGLHKKLVETDFKNFTEVVNDMKKEFQVYEESYHDDEYMCKNTMYKIIDYCGNQYIFAYIIIDD